MSIFKKIGVLVGSGLAALTAGAWLFAQTSTGVSGSGVSGGGGNPKGSNFSIQYRNGNQFGGTGPGSSGQLLTSNGAGSAPTFQAAPSSAPTNATYITQTPNATLTNEQALSALATGILKSTTTTGVVSAALSADVISLWTGTCNNTTFLRADGSCQTPAGGTPGGASTNIQYNNAGAFGGDADFNFNSTTNQVTLGSEAAPGSIGPVTSNNGSLFTVFGGAASGSGNASAAILVRGGESSISEGPGGGATYRGGDGIGTNRGGGAVTVRGGDATGSGAGGILSIEGGNSPSGTDGRIDFRTAQTTRLTIQNDGSWDEGGTQPGTSGQVWTSNGASASPTWQSGGATQTTGNFVASFTDACTTTPTQTWNYVLTGSVVTMRATGTTGGAVCTSDSTNFATAAGDVPASLRPAAAITINGFLCQDNGANISCGLRIETDGTMRYCVNGASGLNTCAAPNWTNSGNKQMTATNAQTTATYNLN